MATAFVMGGLTVCGVTYLLVERLWRPFTVRALETGVPLRPVAPGSMTRTLLAWVLARAMVVAMPVRAIALTRPPTRSARRKIRGPRGL